MELSSDLVRAFVKTTNDSAHDSPQEKEYNATVTAVGERTYVQLDGSDVVTPVLSVISAKVGDRVLVSIKNRTATIKSNYTSPAANATDIANVNVLLAKKAGIEDLQVINESVENLKVGQAAIESAMLEKASITDLNAANAEIGTLKTDKANVTDLNAAAADIASLKTSKADVTDLNAATADIASLKTSKADVTDLTAANAEISTLKTEKADVDFANVDTTAITEAWIKDLMVQGKMIVQNGTVYYLDAVHVNADTIDAGTLKADRLLLHGDDGLYYQINIDKLGETAIQAMTEEEQAELKRTIHADAITAHSITAEQLTVNNIQGTGGWINLAQGTFEYRNAETSNGISWDGEHLSIQADSILFSSGKSAEELIREEVSGLDVGGNSVHYSDTTPTGTHQANDIWFDTAHGNAMYAWDGTQWVQHQFGTVSIADGSVTADKLTALDVLANRILAHAIEVTGSLYSRGFEEDNAHLPYSVSGLALNFEDMTYQTPYFAISNDGAMNCRGGKIGNFVIQDSLYTDNKDVSMDLGYSNDDMPPSISFGSVGLPSDTRTNAELKVGSSNAASLLEFEWAQLGASYYNPRTEDSSAAYIRLWCKNNLAEIGGNLTVSGNISESGVSLVDKYAAKSHTHDDRYYTESEINTKLNGKSDTGHTHDDRYFTETEINNKLKGYLTTSGNAASATKATKAANGVALGINSGDTLSFYGMYAGIVSAGQTSLQFFVPTAQVLESNASPTCTTMSVVVRHIDGGYPYARSGSSGGTYTQLGSGLVSIWASSKTARTNEVASITCTNRTHGVYVNVTFKYQLAKASGNTAAIANNVPVAVAASGKFTFAYD